VREIAVKVSLETLDCKTGIITSKNVVRTKKLFKIELWVEENSHKTYVKLLRKLGLDPHKYIGAFAEYALNRFTENFNSKNKKKKE